MPQPHLTPGKDPVPSVQGAGWASGPVWTGVENLAPTGIRSPDRPGRRQSLYRLCYPTHGNIMYTPQNVKFAILLQREYIHGGAHDFRQISFNRLARKTSEKE